MDSTALDKLDFSDEVARELFVHTIRKLAVRLHLFCENGLAKQIERFFDQGLQCACFEYLPAGMTTTVLLYLTVDREVIVTVDNKFAALQFQKTGFGIGVIRGVTNHLAMDITIVEADTGNFTEEKAKQ
ncbi:MAG: hypothetical protein DRI24_18205 [Deltaproteobacteria bacterium]|nr:MAG: hypothetical protein DRI24_18205 [Deltaproteobacteria bacterium]